MLITKRFQKVFSETNIRPLLIVGVIALILLYLSVILSRLTYPFDLGHQEGLNLISSQHLLDGKNPYAFAFTPPYSMAPYGIVFYALLSVGLKVFGFQLWFGRLLSVLAFVGCLYVVVKIARRITNNTETAMIAGLSCLVMPFGQFWVGMMRSDLIGLFFSLTAVWLVLTFSEEEKIKFWKILLLSLLVCTSIFTKQTFLLESAIIILRLLQLKKWREAIYFVITCSVTISLTMFLLNYTSSGGYFWQHFTHAKTLPFSLSQALNAVTAIFEAPTIIIGIVFLIIFACFNYQVFFEQIRKHKSNILLSPKLLILCYILLSFAWSSISMGRVGANTNYYLEFSFLAAIIYGLIYENLRKKNFTPLALLFLILLISGGIIQIVRVSRGEYFRWQALKYYQEISDTAGKLTPSNSSCISIYVELVARNGCTVNFDDITEYTSGWSPELNQIFVNEVLAGHYAAIVWDSNDFEQSYPNYQLVPMSSNPPEKFYRVYLYVRKVAQ